MYVKVQDEWGELKTAIFHDGGNAIDIPDQESLLAPKTVRRHPENGPVSKDEVMRQQDEFRELLVRAGVELVSPIPQEGAFCQMFTRDPGFVIGDRFFVGKMSALYRRPETQGLEEICEDIRSGFPEGVVHLWKGTIEGGDVIQTKKHTFVGTGETTNTAGFDGLNEALVEIGYNPAVRIPHRGLHLDCCLAPLPDRETALFSRHRLSRLSRAIIQKYIDRLIPLDEEEDRKFLAANIFWLNPEEVISSVYAQRTNAFLRSLGYTVHGLHNDQLIHLWGSTRCAIGPLVRCSLGDDK